jgi:hypothetical protein
MARPDVAHDLLLVQAFYYLQFAFGGLGFAVLMGLLLAGFRSPPASFYFCSALLRFLQQAKAVEMRWLSVSQPHLAFLLFVAKLRAHQACRAYNTSAGP